MRLITGLVLMTLILGGRLTRGGDFDARVEVFIEEYLALKLPPLQLSYRSNLEEVRPLEEVEEQEDFFREQKARFKQTTWSGLDARQRVDLDVIQYEIDLNLERIAMEKKWLEADSELKGSGLAGEVLGKDWYAYFLKRWVDKDLTPDVAYHFGLEEIALVIAKIEVLRQKLGVHNESITGIPDDQRLQIDDPVQVDALYRQLRKRVREQSVHYFPQVDLVPEVRIVRGTNPAMAQVPGFYSDDTFYYNFFDSAYDGGSSHWLLLHEAIPGHHYQFHQRQLVTGGTVREHLRAYSFMEGWGAYVEQLGYLLGLYDTPATEYSMLEWDLIRSVRVVLDVGLNYYDWSDEKALSFWRQHIDGKDEVGLREIERMKQWPAQVITYKYGAAVLNQLRGEIPDKELMAFHTEVLAYGDVPLSVLRKHLKLKE